MNDRRSPFRALLAALGIGLAVVLAGCRVDSIHPISPAETARPDAALDGVWRYRAKGELTYVHIGPEHRIGARDHAGDAGRRVRIVIVDHKPSGLTEESYVAHGSRVGKRRYLNVAHFDKGQLDGYAFVRYELLDRDTLRFSTLDQKRLRDAIAAGRVKGRTDGAGLSSTTAITAEPAEVERFLVSEGDRLFQSPFVLRRVATR